MSHHVHFAAEEPAYKQLIEILVPFEDQLKYKFDLTQSMLDKIILKIWKYQLPSEMRESLRIFIRNNQQSILEHIAALKKNKDAVIIHRSLKLRERFFESVAQAMIAYKELLVSNLPMPSDILKVVAAYLDRFHLWNSEIQSLQSYLDDNKAELLRKISELNEKGVERKEANPIPKVEIVVDINGVNLAPSTFTFPLPTYNKLCDGREPLLATLTLHKSPPQMPLTSLSSPSQMPLKSSPSPPPTPLPSPPQTPLAPFPSPPQMPLTPRPSPPQMPQQSFPQPLMSLVIPRPDILNATLHSKSPKLTANHKSPKSSRRPKCPKPTTRPKSTCRPNPRKRNRCRNPPKKTRCPNPPNSTARPESTPRPKSAPRPKSTPCPKFLHSNRHPNFPKKPLPPKPLKSTRSPNPTPPALMSLQIPRPYTLSSVDSTEAPPRDPFSRRPLPTISRDPVTRFRCWSCGGANHVASHCSNRFGSSQ